MSAPHFTPVDAGDVVIAPAVNTDLGALITATAATTGKQSADQTNTGWRGVLVTITTTAIGTGSVTVTVQGKDSAGGYYTLLAGAAVVTNTTVVYTVYPGLTAAANVTANGIVPRTWRVITTANNANPATYTVSASMVL